MAKKIVGYVKLQIPAGKATPAPPVGPALGQHGLNIMGFCKELNEKTSSLEQYSFFKKIILLLLIVCFILLYSIYKSLNEVPSYSKVSTQKEKIEIPA